MEVITSLQHGHRGLHPSGCYLIVDSLQWSCVRLLRQRAQRRSRRVAGSPVLAAAIDRVANNAAAIGRNFSMRTCGSTRILQIQKSRSPARASQSR